MGFFDSATRKTTNLNYDASVSNDIKTDNSYSDASSSVKDSNNTTNTTNNDYQIDNSQTLDGGVIYDAFNFSGDTANAAFDFSADATDKAINASVEALSIYKEMNNKSLTAMEKATSTALDFASNSTRSDSAMLQDNVSKYAMLAVGVMVVAMVFK
ncbi:hypothetical protein CYQ88_10830 [Hydrogenovibrio sp. SC-1]|uniref:hypothetical protein n=1 Tax=Hydrogenovibrio sp. SC-1 TaxID=2065820 RepID=UPI000C7B1269|nr:hypothetical protein [Hydrogenovibrio sp. SC-1]PLA73509.1 hypothetical protein CYQ88_10830 [Hydrogenovibrio sp. SC-1]